MKEKQQSFAQWPSNGRARFRSTQDFRLRNSDLETPKGQTLTVAGEGYTIKELLEKFTQGIDPMLTKLTMDMDDQDHDDEDYSKLKGLDLAEQQELMENTAARQEQIRTSIEERKKASLEASKIVSDDSKSSRSTKYPKEVKRTREAKERKTTEDVENLED